MHSLTLFLLLTGFNALAQTSVPTVPEQVTFANISIRFDADARRMVQQDVNSLLANRQYWTAKLDRVALYFPVIEPILLEEDVPTDFKYLAVQESSLTPDAVSSSSAVGYWQFKRETATTNGLRVDDEIDERKSITASTHGAAVYLKKNNSQFNNWIASLYSYYLGATGITKLVPPDWSYAREVTLNGRTDRYILRFFAHKIAIESALKSHQASNRFALIEYPNGGGKTVSAIAGELDVDEFELRKYNRWVLGETIPTDKAYVMAVPVLNDRINDLRQKIGSVGSRRTPNLGQNDVGFPVLRRVTTGSGGQNDLALYEINGLPGIQAQAGDGAASLARKAKISVSSFLRYNDMSDRDPVLTNDVYYLAKKRRKALVPFHTVRDGETARSISQRYALRLKKLLRYNRLDRTEQLAVGRVMWLSERRPNNKPVEIINAPTAPVYDRTPTPALRDVAANTLTERNSGNPARPVTGTDGIPRNPSERRLYKPKLVDGGITPNDGTSEPATVQVQRPEPPRPLIRQPAPTPSPATRPTVSRSSTGADGSQRVVIVRSTETAEPQRQLAPAGRETGSAVERTTYDSLRESQPVGPVKVPSGKAPPRPAAPGALDPQPRPAKVPAPVVAAEPKSVTPAEPVIIRPTPVDRSGMTHTVEAGQTYYSISKLYGLTVGELLTLNSLTATDVLDVGKQLTIKAPSTGKSVQPAQPTTISKSPGTSQHIVAKGETLYRISKMYGVTIEQIQNWNKLTDVGVNEGQRLKVNE